MERKEIADRISEKFAAAGHPIDREKLEEKINRFVDEFSVPPAEAERSITSDYARAFGMEIPAVSAPRQNPDDVVMITDIEAEQWVTVVGRIVTLFPSRSPSVAQSGILADSSGTIRFTVWAKANAPEMEQGRWYRIESAVSDEYNRKVNLKVHSGSRIIPVSPDEMATLEITGIGNIKPGIVSIEGKVVGIEHPEMENILERGVIADETGAVKYVIRRTPDAEPLIENEWYRIRYAVADLYRGAISLQIPPGSAERMEEDRSVRPLIVPLAQCGPGIVSLRVKIIQEYESTSDRIFQSGLLGDESGTMRFVTWKDDRAIRLEPDMVYTIYYASVDEYNGRLSLTLNGTACLPDETAVIQVRSPHEEIKGAFVHLSPGSGLIKRCPVEGCGRVLSRQNYCQIHEIQPNYSYDLRIKGWLDTGLKTYDTIISREGVEQLTGITLQSAQEMAENNPLGLDTVFYTMNEQILGRYIICRGRVIDNRLFAYECEFQPFDSGLLAELINRAEGQINE